MSAVTVRDVEAAVAARFPLERAEPWDRVGLSVGDPAASVTGVVLALDPTLEVISHAVELKANVVVTHHPPFIDVPARLIPGAGAGGVVFAAASQGVALINAHTNLDRDPEAQMLLANALGLEAEGPLEGDLQEMTVVTAFVPPEAGDAVRDAMRKAGAGRIGEYEGCSFGTVGTGAFTPMPGAAPVVGRAGESTRTEEERVEMVAPRGLAAQVVAAAAVAHPYREPLIVSTDVAIGRNSARMGMVSSVPAKMTLRGLASVIEATFGVSPKVYGDPDRELRHVATTTGSGTSMLGAARSAQVDAIVLGEVRYHDARDSAENGLAVLEMGHDVSEWPMVALLERVVRSIEGLDESAIHAAAPRPAWWTVP